MPNAQISETNHIGNRSNFAGISSIDIGQDGRYVISSGKNGINRLWDFNSCKEKGTENEIFFGALSDRRSFC